MKKIKHICFRDGCNKETRRVGVRYCSIACRRLDAGLPAELQECAFKPCKRKCPRITQKYCCAEHRKRAENGDDIEATFPEWTCEACGVKSKLDFNPVLDKPSWMDFKCPACGVSRLSTGSILDKY